MTAETTTPEPAAAPTNPVADFFDFKPAQRAEAAEPSADEQFRQEYALALKVGRKRFGSDCEHARTRNGHCLDCLRRVL